MEAFGPQTKTSLSDQIPESVATFRDFCKYHSISHHYEYPFNGGSVGKYLKILIAMLIIF